MQGGVCSTKQEEQATPPVTCQSLRYRDAAVGGTKNLPLRCICQNSHGNIRLRGLVSFFLNDSNIGLVGKGTVHSR